MRPLQSIRLALFRAGLTLDRAIITRAVDKKPWNEAEHPRKENGQFGKGGGLQREGKSDKVFPSSQGANKLSVKGFTSKQKLMNHWKNGRTHKKEYPGFTMEQYVQRAVELAEMPVGGDILGHLDKDGIIIRYDIKENDFVKANMNKGIVTMFKPHDGLCYYLCMKRKDVENGGKG